METNKLLGILFLLTGIADIVFARALGAKLSPAARTGLSTFGIVFLLIGLALSLGFMRMV